MPSEELPAESALLARLEAQGVRCPHPLPPGNPARLTTGRTLGHVARVYDHLEPLLMLGLDRTLRREVTHLATRRPWTRMLDVGCGTGVLTRQLAQAASSGAPRCVVGVDAAPEMIAEARRKSAGLDQVAFLPVLAEALPFADHTFEVAVSTMFFHHIDSGLKRRAVAELWRVLAPGGHAVIADVSPPTNLFGRVCAWSGYLLFRQEEIRENIRGELEAVLAASPFRAWRVCARHAGYVSVYELEK